MWSSATIFHFVSLVSCTFALTISIIGGSNYNLFAAFKIPFRLNVLGVIHWNYKVSFYLLKFSSFFFNETRFSSLDVNASARGTMIIAVLILSWCDSGEYLS